MPLSELEYEFDDEVMDQATRPSPKLSDFYPDWHIEAKCLGTEVEHWFGPTDETKSMSPKQIQRAKMVCETCPVFASCLRSALEQNEQYGVWAGTSGRVRRRIQAMIALNVVTVEEVVSDYVSGQRGKYEEQRAKQGIDADLRGRKARVRLAAAG